MGGIHGCSGGRREVLMWSVIVSVRPSVCPLAGFCLLLSSPAMHRPFSVGSMHLSGLRLSFLLLAGSSLYWL